MLRTLSRELLVIIGLFLLVTRKAGRLVLVDSLELLLSSAIGLADSLLVDRSNAVLIVTLEALLLEVVVPLSPSSRVGSLGIKYTLLLSRNPSSTYRGTPSII